MIVVRWSFVDAFVDTAGPKISFSSNLPRTTKRNPTFTWTSSESAKFKCGIDNSYKLVDCDQGTSGRWTGENVQDGSHVFIVYGVDGMNNRGENARHRFIVGKYVQLNIGLHFPVCVYCNRSQKTSQRVKNNSHVTRLTYFFVLYTLWRHLWTITVHTYTEKCYLFVK